MRALDAASLLLVVLTPISYLPLYHRLLVLKSSDGISIPAILLLTLSAQAQIVTMYYLMALHPDTRYGSVIATPPSFQDWLSLAQIVTQWACSLLLLVLVIALSAPSASDVSLEPVSVSLPGHRRTCQPAKTAAIVLLHAVLSLFWIQIAGKSLRQINNLAYLVIMDFNAVILNPLITLTVVIASAWQASETKATTQPNALSKTSLSLQILVFLALALSWPFRIKLPKNLSDGDLWWALTEWYPYVGWPCVNNAALAVGQFVVLYTLAGVTGRRSGEGEALLSSSS